MVEGASKHKLTEFVAFGGTKSEVVFFDFDHDPIEDGVLFGQCEADECVGRGRGERDRKVDCRNW